MSAIMELVWHRRPRRWDLPRLVLICVIRVDQVVRLCFSDHGDDRGPQIGLFLPGWGGIPAIGALWHPYPSPAIPDWRRLGSFPLCSFVAFVVKAWFPIPRDYGDVGDHGDSPLPPGCQLGFQKTYMAASQVIPIWRGFQRLFCNWRGVSSFWFVF
jgi:hypothetical protein